MSIAAEPRRYTPDDLLTMPDGDRYELVEGELVDRDTSMESSWIAGEIAGRIRDFIRDKRLGWVFPEGTSYPCFPDDPRRVRKPDVSYFTAQRLPNGPLPEGHCPLAPDLPVEVVSPNDLFYEVDIKVEEWLKVGVRIVWVVIPATRKVSIYRQGTPSPTTLQLGDHLDGEEVLPGFRCAVKDLFPQTPATSAS